MQELLNKLMNEVGLNAEQAQKTMTTVMEFVKSKLPPALANNVDAMFSGAQGQMPEQSYKYKAEDFAEATKEKLEDLQSELGNYVLAQSLAPFKKEYEKQKNIRRRKRSFE